MPTRPGPLKSNFLAVSATAEKEAKSKSSFWAKVDDPVGYTPETGMANLVAKGKPVWIVEDVHNTGESWLAFAQLLKESGVEVQGVAALAATETRRTSARDIERLSEKVATLTGTSLDEVKPMMQDLFDGSFKQLFNKAERAVTDNAASARRLVVLARERAKKGGGETANRSRDAQAHAGANEGKGNQDGVSTFSLSPLRRMELVENRLAVMLNQDSEQARKFAEKGNERLGRLKSRYAGVPAPKTKAELDKQQAGMVEARRAELEEQTPSHPVSAPHPMPTRPGPLKSNFLAVTPSPLHIQCQLDPAPSKAIS